ncbi:predicted protein [Postia placenta Mad-698-R]|nr:predicted protein [Postia placenta Mad-698-R]
MGDCAKQASNDASTASRQPSDSQYDSPDATCSCNEASAKLQHVTTWRGDNSMMEIDMHLTQLLSSMTLNGPWRPDILLCNLEKGKRRVVADLSSSDSAHHACTTHTDVMSQPNLSGSSNYTATVDVQPPCGCALLQGIRDQLLLERYPTTGGEYLEAIFTHREVFFAFPEGHQMCAIGFTDLAKDLETRNARADRDGDGEAAAAFRHEAWVIASNRGRW